MSEASWNERRQKAIPPLYSDSRLEALPCVRPSIVPALRTYLDGDGVAVDVGPYATPPPGQPPHQEGQARRPPQREQRLQVPHLEHLPHPETGRGSREGGGRERRVGPGEWHLAAVPCGRGMSSPGRGRLTSAWSMNWSNRSARRSRTCPSMYATSSLVLNGTSGRRLSWLTQSA